MKRFLAGALCWLGLMLAPGSLAQTSGALPTPIVQLLAKAGLSGATSAASVGIYIAEPGAARPLLQSAPDQAFIAASTMKLVTTLAALELLGPQYRWYTHVLTTGRVEQGVLEGHLIFRGGNDPSLTWARIDDLVKRLRKRGIHTLNGNIVVDRRLYQAPANEMTPYYAQTIFPFNSPPDSLVVNSKTVTLRLTPDARSRSVVASVEPPLESVQTRGEVAYVDGPCVTQPVVELAGEADAARITLNGKLALGCGPRSMVLSVLGHREYFQQAFVQLWKAAGGIWHGQFEDYSLAHQRTTWLDQMASLPLTEVVKTINKDSHNLMSQQLFMQLALSDPAPKIHGALGVRAFDRVRRLFAEKGVDVTPLVMENGSGVSFNERVSPRALANLLNFALERPYSKVFAGSLPLAGVDGTMFARLTQSPVRGKALLKTGSLPEVRCLAGYVHDASGKLYLAAILVNHRNAAAAVPAIDATIEWVHLNAGATPQ